MKKLSRRELLQLFLKSSTGMAALPAINACARREERPNILVLVTDDQRSDTLGIAGNKIIKTPNMDRLALDGTFFTNSFVTSSICAVSRASILTGQYARRHGIHDFLKPLSEEALENTYPVVLRRQGYLTGFIGKWGVGAKDMQALQTPADFFDYWKGFSAQGDYFPNPETPERHMTQIITKQVETFLDEAALSDAPFCLSVSYKAPHGPFREFDHRYKGLYRHVDIPLSPSFQPSPTAETPDFLKNSIGARNLRRIRARRKGGIESHVRNYYRLISGVDDSLGYIRQLLGKLGLADNTVILFTSDNGMMFGEHGYKGKWLMYEESIRTPFVLYYLLLDKARPNQQSSAMVLNIDLAPTVLDIAGIQAPDKMQGMSMLPLLHHGDAPWRKAWFYEHWPGGVKGLLAVEGVRTKQWKYTHYPNQLIDFEELYDLKNDPLEQINLASSASYRTDIVGFREKCKQYREKLT